MLKKCLREWTWSLVLYEASEVKGQCLPAEHKLVLLPVSSPSKPWNYDTHDVFIPWSHEGLSQAVSLCIRGWIYLANLSHAFLLSLPSGKAVRVAFCLQP